MIVVFQILVVSFSVAAVGGIFGKKRGGLLGAKGAFFWILFWVSTDIAVLWPNATTIIANHLGIGRGADLVLYLSLIVNFYLLFKLHVKVEGVSRDVTRVVRRDALRSSDLTKE